MIFIFSAFFCRLFVWLLVSIGCPYLPAAWRSDGGAQELGRARNFQIPH